MHGGAGGGGGWPLQSLTAPISRLSVSPTIGSPIGGSSGGGIGDGGGISGHHHAAGRF